MALIDDINALPPVVGDDSTGHLNNHQVIHAALKDHESRLGARDIGGTGYPERKVAAAIGTVYTDSAATDGAIRWTKTSGTGTTGWRVLFGDTGWRNITSLAENTVAGYRSVMFRQLNGMAKLIFDIQLDPNTTSSVIIPDVAFSARVLRNLGLARKVQPLRSTRTGRTVLC